MRSDLRRTSLYANLHAEIDSELVGWVARLRERHCCNNSSDAHFYAREVRIINFGSRIFHNTKNFEEI